MYSINLVERFFLLFRGNERSVGVFIPPNKMFTEKRKLTVDNCADHLGGKIGAGVVPIMDDGNCWFGVIDIDAHGDADDIDLFGLEKEVRIQNFPLTVCRSKSGGAHLYLFTSEPVPATIVRAALTKWSSALGYMGAEIFPKQEKLSDEGGNRQLGNWINLCWFDAMNPECLRYTVEGGKKVPFEYFLEIAENRRVGAALLNEGAADEHAEAPPCIQKFIHSGVDKGYRNQALYNFAIYAKQAFPEIWRDKCFDFNVRSMGSPLSHNEAKKIIDSISRRNYRYKCKEEPCKSNCKASVCITREFGITPDEKGILEIGTPPQYGPLHKYETDPPRWELFVDGVPVNLSTVELMDHRAIRISAMERLTKLIAPLNNDSWMVTLNDLLKSAARIEAPKEASTSGIIKSRLYEFFQRCDLSSPGTDPLEREALLLGAPCVLFNAQDGSRRVYFRGPDFIDYLKKSKSEEMKGSNLWIVLKNAGVQHTRIRVGGTPMPVWYMQLEESDSVEIHVPDVNPEI